MVMVESDLYWGENPPEVWLEDSGHSGSSSEGDGDSQGPETVLTEESDNNSITSEIGTEALDRTNPTTPLSDQNGARTAEILAKRLDLETLLLPLASAAEGKGVETSAGGKMEEAEVEDVKSDGRASFLAGEIDGGPSGFGGGAPGRDESEGVDVASTKSICATQSYVKILDKVRSLEEDLAEMQRQVEAAEAAAASSEVKIDTAESATTRALQEKIRNLEENLAEMQRQMEAAESAAAAAKELAAATEEGGLQILGMETLAHVEELAKMQRKVEAAESAADLAANQALREKIRNLEEDLAKMQRQVEAAESAAAAAESKAAAAESAAMRALQKKIRSLEDDLAEMQCQVKAAESAERGYLREIRIFEEHLQETDRLENAEMAARCAKLKVKAADSAAAATSAANKAAESDAGATSAATAATSPPPASNGASADDLEKLEAEVKKQDELIKSLCEEKEALRETARETRRQAEGEAYRGFSCFLVLVFLAGFSAIALPPLLFPISTQRSCASDSEAMEMSLGRCTVNLEVLQRAFAKDLRETENTQTECLKDLEEVKAKCAEDSQEREALRTRCFKDWEEVKGKMAKELQETETLRAECRKEWGELKATCAGDLQKMGSSRTECETDLAELKSTFGLVDRSLVSCEGRLKEVETDLEEVAHSHEACKTDLTECRESLDGAVDSLTSCYANEEILRSRFAKRKSSSCPKVSFEQLYGEVLKLLRKGHAKYSSRW